jgi:hypothetical protein
VDTDELTIVVTAPAAASPLERDGMLRRVKEAVGDAITDITTHGYLTHGSVNPGNVQLQIAAPDLASPDILAAVGDAVTAVLDDPDALGWGPFTLDVTQESQDPESGPDPLDEAVRHLRAVPDGEDSRLSDPAGHPSVPVFYLEPARQRLRADADHLRGGLDPQWLTAHDVHATDADEREAAFTEARYVAGALYQAAVITVDYLFSDLAQLTSTRDHTATVATAESAAFFVLEDLPTRYAHRYDILFVKRFIVATITVTQRLTAGWDPLACVAEELALRVLLDEAEARLDEAGLDLPHWRATIEDYLFEDADHEMLFDPSLDGIEDDEDFLARTRTAPMAFPEWFTPFNDERPIPPYLLDTSRRKRPAK